MPHADRGFSSVDRSRYAGSVPGARYRCTLCGNLTRFDVTTARRTRSFHHYSVGGELTVENTEVLSESVESVVCRWCGPSAKVEPLDADDPVSVDATD